MSKRKQKGWFSRLLDMNDDTISASTVFLIATSVVALMLLIVPMVGIVVDICCNHTITINMGDLAQYIASAAGVFAAGGVLKGWTNYSSYRFKKKSKQTPQEEDEQSPEE